MFIGYGHGRRPEVGSGVLNFEEKHPLMREALSEFVSSSTV